MNENNSYSWNSLHNLSTSFTILSRHDLFHLDPMM